MIDKIEILANKEPENKFPLTPSFAIFYFRFARTKIKLKIEIKVKLIICYGNLNSFSNFFSKKNIIGA